MDRLSLEGLTDYKTISLDQLAEDKGSFMSNDMIPVWYL